MKKKNKYKTTFSFICKLLLFFSLSANIAFSSFTTRLKDILELSDVRENVFTGYGIVVGLPGTGDRRNSSTAKSLKNYLSKQGIELDNSAIQLRNSAMVMVSATTKGFLGPGDNVLVQVASIGNARSIENGLLLPTSLRAANNQIYLTGSGIVSTSSENPTRGTIVNGGIVDKNFSNNANSSLYNRNTIFLKVNNNFPDYSGNIKDTLSETYPNYSIQIIGEKQISIAKQNNQIFTASEILELMALEVELSPPAKIIIDTNTGVVVMGEEVKINPIHISLPSVSLTLGASNLNSRSGGNFTEARSLMEELNKLNANPNEITAIFNALKKSGAINADLILQ